MKEKNKEKGTKWYCNSKVLDKRELIKFYVYVAKYVQQYERSIEVEFAW